MQLICWSVLYIRIKRINFFPHHPSFSLPLFFLTVYVVSEKEIFGLWQNEVYHVIAAVLADSTLISKIDLEVFKAFKFNQDRFPSMHLQTLDLLFNNLGVFSKHSFTLSTFHFLRADFGQWNVSSRKSSSFK